jgi:hypothetical protein
MSDLPNRAKWSYVTRRVKPSSKYGIGSNLGESRLGDLVVARITAIGNHTHMEDVHGRRRVIYTGDWIIGAFANRYASDYYEGYFMPGPTAHLLAASGLIGTVASTHARYAEPTCVEIAGPLVDSQGHPLSLEAFSRAEPQSAKPRFGTWVVVGSSMNAGKTTTTSAIARGWARARLHAGAGKITGSGSGKDMWSYLDAGADPVCDFLDFGISSTYGYPLDRLRRTMTWVRDALLEDGADAVVLEIADGLLQPETQALLPSLLGFADGVVLAVGDPLAAIAGTQILRDRHALPLRAISGLITASPLASREATEMTGLPVLSPTALSDGGAMDLLAPETQVA